jgi:toxin ParE1/3/4
MKWRLAPQAERDLLAIADYIALNSPRAADDLVERFRRRWRLLTTQPYSGPARPDIAPDIRHLVIGSYLTLYRVNSDHIEILRVLHGRRDLGEGEPRQGD